MEALGEFPDQGRVVPEWGDEGVREILYEPYRVIYEVFPEEVHILTLSHFRQELQDR
ncbi:type II toxin-antitoxin system RelE/ParE family toxin [Gaopeijia maritima]|uniref:type II toxin-antitoxin system RelE/ParE family toxin n=1 Tax=Gaopeijia maritima TaxID=3119007 RepID=UPI00386F1A07